jgi:hypothetical protein
MACRKCHELRDAYKRSVTLFTTAEGNMRGLVGDHSKVALIKLRLLHEACLDANAAVTEHWRQDHNDLRQAVGAP